VEKKAPRVFTSYDSQQAALETKKERIDLLEKPPPPLEYVAPQPSPGE
jgi:hypothetical protein